LEIVLEKLSDILTTFFQKTDANQRKPTNREKEKALILLDNQ
jgi:hypothetical protein